MQSLPAWMYGDDGNLLSTAEGIRRAQNQAIIDKAQNRKPHDPFAPPDPPLPSSQELLARIAAAESGKQAARAAAEQREAERRKATEGPLNAAEVILQTNALGTSDSYHPAAKFRKKLLKDMADNRQKAIDAAQKEADRLEKINNDPAVLNARENARFTLKAVPPEFKAEAAENQAIADEGETALYWERERSLMQRV